jgi:hypothetical protein
MNKYIPTFESFINESIVTEAKSLLFSFDYNTDEDDVDYIQGLLKDARVDAIAQPGLDSEEMIVKAKNEVELRKAKKAIQANGFQIYESIVTEAVKEVVLSNEILDFLEERGILKGSDAQKVHKDLTAFLKEKGINESIDIKYWEDYNTDTSGQGKKEHEVKSKDFEDTFEDAVVYWNQEADGAENRIKGAQIQKIKKLAQEFFKKAGWISSNVIQAMIAQES